MTAGNASPLNDGASMMLIGDEQAGRLVGREPLARIVATGAHGVDPDVFGIAPVEAVNVALARAGIGWGEVVAVELNEAFASQSLACLASWPELDPELVNVRGGAIAIGHPLGASGARILGRLAHELRARGGGYGVAAICIGVAKASPSSWRVQRHDRSGHRTAADLRPDRRHAVAATCARRGVHPPLDYPAYKSTRCAIRKQPLVYLPQNDHRDDRSRARRRGRGSASSTTT